ncbi:MAG: hypothetical protein KAI17_08425, partial [Thiotrichaceae bacterium]|nr:hypothetical protein [Thiotrichaceae bacterium]
WCRKKYSFMKTGNLKADYQPKAVNDASTLFWTHDYTAFADKYCYNSIRKIRYTGKSASIL